MAEPTKLSVLLTRQAYIITGTEEQVMCMEAGIKKQVSRPHACIAVKKGEEGSSPRSLSLLTTLMVVWKLPSGVSVYVLGWERFF